MHCPSQWPQDTVPGTLFTDAKWCPWCDSLLNCRVRHGNCSETLTRNWVFTQWYSRNPGEGENFAQITRNCRISVWEAFRTHRTVGYPCERLAQLTEPVGYE